MTCNQCDSELVCRLKDYGGNFAPSLQWQNYDGTAHYKTADGKKFECNIPDDEESAQTRIPTEVATTPGTPPTSATNTLIIDSLDEIKLKLASLDEMIQAIFRYTVDKQLEKK